MPTRSQIVMMARGFVGTPFVHQGRLPGAALDCIGLPLMIAEVLGVIDVHGVPIKGRDGGCNYGPQPQSDVVLDACKERLTRVHSIKPGNVLVLAYPTVACHSGIATENGCFVHADPTAGRVTESMFDLKWQRRLRGIFEFPGTVN